MPTALLEGLLQSVESPKSQSRTNGSGAAASSSSTFSNLMSREATPCSNGGKSIFSSILWLHNVQHGVPQAGSQAALGSEGAGPGPRLGGPQRAATVQAGTLPSGSASSSRGQPAHHLVDVVHSEADLLEQPAGLALRESLPLGHQLVEVAAGRIVQGKDQVLLSQDHLQARGTLGVALRSRTLRSLQHHPKQGPSWRVTQFVNCFPQLCALWTPELSSGEPDTHLTQSNDMRVLQPALVEALRLGKSLAALRHRRSHSLSCPCGRGRRLCDATACIQRPYKATVCMSVQGSLGTQCAQVVLSPTCGSSVTCTGDRGAHWSWAYIYIVSLANHLAELDKLQRDELAGQRVGSHANTSEAAALDEVALRTQEVL